MDIVIVGNGKLSNSLFKELPITESRNVFSWKDYNKSSNKKIIIIHAGSGRELHEAIDYCKKTDSILVELSTGGNIEDAENITIINCPNTALSVLKLMMMLSEYGKIFKNEKIEIIESHQSTKTTLAGTAVELAKYLGVSEDKIKSIRDSESQKQIGIPEEFLDLHAYHKIKIQDEGSEIIIEAKVLGHKAYVSGLEKIISYLEKNKLEKKEYSIVELALLSGQNLNPSKIS